MFDHPLHHQTFDEYARRIAGACERGICGHPTDADVARAINQTAQAVDVDAPTVRRWLTEGGQITEKQAKAHQDMTANRAKGGAK